jgi:hypothetical protein
MDVRVVRKWIRVHRRRHGRMGSLGSIIFMLDSLSSLNFMVPQAIS